MYKQLFKKSWYLLFYNLRLALPDLLWVTSTIVIGSIIGYFAGIYSLLTNGVTSQALFSLLKEQYLRVIVSLGIFFFTTFILGVSFASFKYLMIREVVTGKKK